MSFDKEYKKLIEQCLEGTLRPTRGVPAFSILGVTIRHDMSLGFPATTLRALPFKSVAIETDFYLKGLTDKKWLKDRGCNFWSHWSSPTSDDEHDLGPIYGFEWRNWGKKYRNESSVGIDQLKNLISEIKTNPESKRLVVTQWNPTNMEHCSIPPCPFAFQILKYGNTLNMVFYQRSVDVCLGLPNDFAQYALLLQLICNQTGYIPGEVVGMFGQAELYENHLENAKELLKRDIKKYPQLIIDTKINMNNFNYLDASLEDYQHHKKLNFKISV
jgi:thymidylate synthase